MLKKPNIFRAKQSKIRKPVTLKNVLILPFIILISLAVLLTSYFTWKFNIQTTSLLGEQISKQTALRMEEKLSYYLNNAEKFNNTLKDPINYPLIDIQDREAVLAYIKHITRQNPSIATLSFTYPDGSYMGISNTPEGKLLKKIASPDTDRVFFTYDLSTNRVIQRKADYDARQRPWFIEARAVKQPIWSSVFEMYSNGKLGITYSEALYADSEYNNETNNERNSEVQAFIGVIGTDIFFDELNQQLKDIRLTNSSYLFILDAQGHVIAQSDLDESHSGTALYHYYESDNALLQQAGSFIMSQDDYQTNPIHDDSTFLVEGVNKDYYINSIPYGFDKGLNWHIGVVIPKSDFLGQVNAVRKNTFFIWVVSFVLSVILGLIITYLINRAINRLHNKINEVEKTGSMYEHDKSHGIKEMRDLSLAFSLMSRRLHESYLDIKINNEALEDILSKRTESLKEANQQLKDASHTDGLTKLANRRSFDYFLQFNWDGFENKEVDNLTLLMCDVDCFEQYNEAYGYISGDRVLKQCAEVIKHSVRQTDIVTRYGGEEFAIIMPNADIEDAMYAAKKIIEAVYQLKIPHRKSEVSDYVTVSVGIASTSCTTMEDKYELINRADVALYFAKQEGRNCYVVYNDDDLNEVDNMSEKG